MTWFQFWLIVHIFTAIVAFGPTFVFMVAGGFVEGDPRHAAFGLRLFEIIETRLILPFAVFMAVSGIALIRIDDLDLSKTKWLGSAIVVYIVAVALGAFHQLPATRKLLAATVANGDAGIPETAQGLQVRLRAVGGLLSLMLLSIVVLMIAKPGA